MLLLSAPVVEYRFFMPFLSAQDLPQQDFTKYFLNLNFFTYIYDLLLQQLNFFYPRKITIIFFANYFIVMFKYNISSI
jgi:hypothetical protein